jgi:hypothetical protein
VLVPLAMVKWNGWMQGPWRFIAAALLLVVVAHATAPVAQPFDRAAGSAFSAATSDVSLACGQTVLVAKKALPDDSDDPPFVAFSQASLSPAVTDCRRHVIGLGPTGPPAERTSFHPLNPRAPPAA